MAHNDIISDDTIKEIVEARIKAFCKSDDGEEFIEKTFSDSLEKFFQYRYSGYNDSFKNLFTTYIMHFAGETLNASYADGNIKDIFILGITEWVKQFGLEVIKSEKGE